MDREEPAAALSELRALLETHGVPRAEDAPESIREALVSLLRTAERRVASAQELSRVQERSQMLSEASFEGIVIHSDGVVLDVNQRLADMLGYEPAELIGRNLLDFSAPEDLSAVTQRVRDHVEGEYVAGGVRKDGSRFRGEILSKQGQLGARPVRVSAIRDVTDRERTSAMLRESETCLRELARVAFDILVYSRDGVIVDMVGKVQEVYGRPKDALIGQRIVDLVTPESLERTRQGLEFQKAGPYPSEFLGENGSTVPVEVVAVTTTLGGVPTRLTGVRDMRDVRRAEAEHRALEQQLQRTQRLESLGVLAGGIAHDFNNLLVGILGSAELLELAALSPVDRESVQAIREAGERAATLTTQLLAYAGQRELGQRAPIRLDMLVDELRRMLGPTLSHRARLNTSIDGDAVVLGNRATLLQVLMNLLTNASDALGSEAGTISVRGRLVRDPGERFKHALGALDRAQAAPWVLIEISDTGSGMDERTKDRVFEPFFTTKTKGHGLGLAACLGIVAAHGGAIHVESAPGRGSTFSVLLPSAAAPRPRSETPRGRTSPRRILVVDDDATVRRQIVRMAEARGHTVVEASDAFGAFAVLAGGGVELVLLDVTMPEMGGIDIVREARARGYRVPIVLMSGYSDFPLETRL
ncbi:MAG TPA: PAS domain S-box protein, partial [Polyangiaceae bacterium]|nr:PAS domain S-box protein [Polyangiaceae bacterium]